MSYCNYAAPFSAEKIRVIVLTGPARISIRLTF